jgi:hypothetical protein
MMAVTLCLILIAASPAPTTRPAPDLKEVAEQGVKSLGLMNSRAAQWRSVLEIKGIPFIVTTLVDHGRKRMEFSVTYQGEQAKLAQIIERDNAWYVTQEGEPPTKYRPFEAVFKLATIMMFHELADARFVNDASDNIGDFESLDGNIATYRTPLVGEMRKMVERTIQANEEMIQHSATAPPPENVTMVNKLKDLLAKGIARRIDVTNGLIVETGTVDRRYRVEDFRWLDRVDDGSFDISKTKWVDVTSDPTTGDLDDLLMIGYSGTWRKGQRTPDTDTMLISTRGAQVRRVPFKGMLCMPGCFLRDRSRVVVTGVSAETGAIFPCEVNLKNGENRPLGGEALRVGYTFGPVLSPDGKLVAVTHTDSSLKFLTSQVWLIDVESGKARAIGVPQDMAFPSWAPDGQSLFITIRTPTPDPNQVPDANTYRMKLDGSTENIVHGDSAKVLSDGRLLFQDRTDRLWKTCSLDGKNIKPLGDGMKQYAFPTLSPDGLRLIMQHVSDEGPWPEVFTLSELHGTPLNLPKGLWVLPTWQ